MVLKKGGQCAASRVGPLSESDNRPTSQTCDLLHAIYYYYYYYHFEILLLLLLLLLQSSSYITITITSPSLTIRPTITIIFGTISKEIISYTCIQLSYIFYVHFIITKIKSDYLIQIENIFINLKYN